MSNWFEASRAHLIAPEDCPGGEGVGGKAGLSFSFQLLRRLHAQINQLPPSALRHLWRASFACSY